MLLVHEWLYTWAGAERVLEEMMQVVPHADVLSGVITSDMRHAHPIAARARESWVGAIPGARRNHRWFLPLHALAFATFDTRDYDLVVSISHGFEKMIRARRGAAHVCYCLSPPRYLWDMQAEHEALGSLPERVALRFAAATFRAVDRRGATGVDRFVSISRHVADRVKRAYGRSSSVVYPPVRGRRKPAAQEGVATQPFLLTLGRLVPYKRVDLAVQAAERLGMKLVVAGDGPERAALERLAGPNTEFVGSVSDDDASRLLSECSAFVFCAQEDFGIAPVEANAFGKPVVAYRPGAASETLRDGETAVFFERQTVTDVVEAIERCLGMSWDPCAIERNARRFAPERFRAEMRTELEQAVGR